MSELSIILERGRVEIEALGKSVYIRAISEDGKTVTLAIRSWDGIEMEKACPVTFIGESKREAA